MKIFVLTFGLFMFSIVVKSQFINGISANYGISLSDLNLESNVSYFRDLGAKSIVGFYSGINIESFEGKYLAFVTGIGFYQKGGLDKFNDESSINWNLDYLTIDAKLKAKYRYKNLSPYLLLGPRIDYMLKHGRELDAINNNDVKINKINYGLRYGIGLQYFIDNFFVGLGWENNYNLNSIVDNNGKSVKPEFTIDDKTMIFKCEIGFLFNK